MSKEILMVVDAVSNEKGVEKDIIFEAIEAALAAAYRKEFGNKNPFKPKPAETTPTKIKNTSLIL